MEQIPSRVPPKETRGEERINVPSSRDNYPYGKFVRSSLTNAGIQETQSEPILHSVSNVEARRVRSTGYLTLVGYAILGALIVLASLCTIAGVVGLHNLKYFIDSSHSSGDKRKPGDIFAPRQLPGKYPRKGIGSCHELPVQFSTSLQCLRTSVVLLDQAHTKSVGHVTCKSNNPSGCKTVFTGACNEPKWNLLKMNSLSKCDSCKTKPYQSSTPLDKIPPDFISRKSSLRGFLSGRISCDENPPNEINCAKIIDDDDDPVEDLLVNYMCRKNVNCEVALTIQCLGGKWRIIFNRTMIEKTWKCEC